MTTPEPTTSPAYTPTGPRPEPCTNSRPWTTESPSTTPAEHNPRRETESSRQRLKVDESVYTPGSVPRGRYPPRVDGHPSRPAIADRFQRPTRRLGRAVLERLLSGLAPGGVCLAASVT